MSKKTKLILAGGFLGAGKTTLLLKAAELLRERGLRVGIITNDQAAELVDTALVKKSDIAVVEVSGGCFCCNFHDLMKSIQTLEEKVKPDVILAEPVGSCTDLMATIYRPISLYHKDRFDLAPYTVLADPNRTLSEFDDNVKYLYDRQLQEADTIVVSKRDSVSEDVFHQFQNSLSKKYPDNKILNLSSKNNIHVREWLDYVMSESSSVTKSLDLDYEIYTEAEAALGWLNGAVTFIVQNPFSATSLIVSLTDMIRSKLKEENAAVAHLKIFATTKSGEVYKASMIDLNSPLSWDLFKEDHHDVEIRFIINARVSLAPEKLDTIIKDAIQKTAEKFSSAFDISGWRFFRPLPPKPTYRIPAGAK